MKTVTIKLNELVSEYQVGSGIVIEGKQYEIISILSFNNEKIKLVVIEGLGSKIYNL